MKNENCGNEWWNAILHDTIELFFCHIYVKRTRSWAERTNLLLILKIIDFWLSALLFHYIVVCVYFLSVLSSKRKFLDINYSPGIRARRHNVVMVEGIKSGGTYYLPVFSDSKYNMWSELRSFWAVVTGLLSPWARADASPNSFIISEIFAIASLKNKSNFNDICYTFVWGRFGCINRLLTVHCVYRRWILVAPNCS